jgi:hypothetical protein
MKRLTAASLLLALPGCLLSTAPESRVGTIVVQAASVEADSTQPSLLAGKTIDPSRAYILDLAVTAHADRDTLLIRARLNQDASQLGQDLMIGKGWMVNASASTWLRGAFCRVSEQRPDRSFPVTQSTYDTTSYTEHLVEVQGRWEAAGRTLILHVPFPAAWWATPYPEGGATLQTYRYNPAPLERVSEMVDQRTVDITLLGDPVAGRTQ